MALTLDRQAFAHEYLVDRNAGAAAVRAGYSGKHPRQYGSRLLKQPEVAAAIAKAQSERIERTGITADYVLNGLKELADRCMSEEQWSPGGAARAFELLGKHLELWTDKQKNELSGGLVIGWDNGENNDSV